MTRIVNAAITDTFLFNP